MTRSMDGIENMCDRLRAMMQQAKDIRVWRSFVMEATPVLA